MKVFLLLQQILPVQPHVLLPAIPAQEDATVL